MFAVTIDRPYYPDIAYYENENEAQRAFKEKITALWI